MRYGYFDDASREYVIQTPMTPLPWINYLGNDDFFGLVSNTMGGYTFYRDARLQRLTRFRYNNVPADTGGRYYYVKEKGQPAWNPGFSPSRTELDDYRCHHGLGYTTIKSEKKQLKSELTVFIPLEETCEIHRLRLTNASEEMKTVTLHSMAEFCLWDAVDDGQNYQRNLNLAEVEVSGSVIYHKTEYRERRDHYAYYSVNRPIQGFDTDRDTFLGAFRGFDDPKAVAEATSFQSMAHGWYPIGSHRLDLRLSPGEDQELIFILGYARNDPDEKWQGQDHLNKAPARRVIDRFSSPPAVEQAFSKLRAYWTDLLSTFRVKSAEKRMDRMVNIWNQYQCMVTFNISRSASYYETGMGRGIGFRDGHQDILGFVHLIPEKARERILDLAAVQFADGSAYHQFQPLTKKGNDALGSGFNDDPLWLIASTAAYIRETGDAGILGSPVPFADEPDSQATLFDHLRRSIAFTLGNRGPHRLPLIGRADWNDCLNLNCFSTTPGESFQTTANFESGIAESIFIAGMFVLYGRQFAELCERFGSKEEALETLRHVEEMEAAVYAHGWDGDWFLRAYGARGEKIGARSNDEGRIFIEPQGMCGMADLGLQNGYAEKALDSVQRHLVNDYGIELLSPCYTRYRLELGEITSYPPGYKENGSVFAHNNPWISIAETRIRRGNEAFDHYTRISPAYLEDVSEIRRTEPYVYSQTIAGRESASYGEAKNSWLTGTAAWSFVNITQAILGIQPDYDGLRILPCLPDRLDHFTIQRKFRGCLYHIEMEKAGLPACEITLDGELLPGDLIPVQKKAECHVKVRV